MAKITGIGGVFFKTPEEMARDFPGLEQAMARTLEVAERCNVELELGRILLPTFPVPEGRDSFDYPTFNVADIVISFGVVMLLIDGFKRDDKKVEKKPAEKSAEPEAT